MNTYTVKRKSVERFSQMSSIAQSRGSIDPRITLKDIDYSVDRSNTFMMNTQTPYLDDKYVNILIHATLDNSMDSDWEIRVKSSANEEISILEEF